MSILTRRERERLVLDLYNQGKTIREIAKEVRMSFRDIGVILNKALEEKKSEGSKEEQDNIESSIFIDLLGALFVAAIVFAIITVLWIIADYIHRWNDKSKEEIDKHIT